MGADRQSGETDLGGEHLAVERWPDSVGRCVAEGEGGDRQREHQYVVATGHGKQIQGHQCRRRQRTVDEHRLASDAVGKLPEQRLSTQRHDVGDHDQPERLVRVQAHLLAVGDGQVGEHRGDRGDEGAEDHSENVAPVVTQQRLQRHPGDGARGFRLFEFRGLVQAATNEVGDHHHDGAEPERHPPTPREQVFVGQRHDRDHH